jgi:hypothetical protein
MNEWMNEWMNELWRVKVSCKNAGEKCPVRTDNEKVVETWNVFNVVLAGFSGATVNQRLGEELLLTETQHMTI